MLRDGTQLTTNGCLTLSGNVPYDIYEHGGAAWTDNSVGPCPGPIGNGDEAIIPTPRLMACGFPEPGNLDVSASYSLVADCEIAGSYFISEDVSITVVGNGHTMRASRADYSFYTAATSDLRLENVALEGIRFLNWGDFSADRVKAAKANEGVMYNIGEARFSNALFEDNSATSDRGRSGLFAHNAYQNGFTSITDSAFRNNQGGYGVLAVFGATIELNGCVTFENNSPADTFDYDGRGTVTDNRDEDCDTLIIDPVIPPEPEPELDGPEIAAAPIPVAVIPDLCNPHCDEAQPSLQWDECGLRLGAIGMICRPKAQPPVANIWRIRPDPQGQHLPAIGTYLFSANQQQVEAVASGIVACSEDGRAAVRMGLTDELRQIFSLDPNYREDLKGSRRYIIISKGPTEEGKIHNIVLDNSLDGHVFGTVDTYGGPPGADCALVLLPAPVEQPAEPFAATNQLARFVRPQPPQPDGSIIHVVGAGDTTSAIAIAYRVSQQDIIALNQLPGTGDLITVGQRLLIRAAPE